MEKIEHKFLAVNGINMHYAELGQGPIVLFIHGFPELWYSWRHQIVYMAEHGYRAVAPDLRGYGDTTATATTAESPDAINDDVSKFSTFHLVGDLVALLQIIAPKEEDKVFVVGHDWGAIIAWHLCLFRPDKIKALVNLSVAFLRRDPNTSYADLFRNSYGDDHYICRFQEPGDIEAEFSAIGVEKVIKKLFTNRDPGPLYFPKGKGLGSDIPIILPSWLTEEDVKYYVSKFQNTGFAGGVNYYRALKLTWELIAPWTGAKVQVPTKFVVGDLDLAYHMLGMNDNYIHNGRFQEDVPLLKEIVVLKGVAHFLNQEMPDEINKHIFDFIQQF